MIIFCPNTHNLGPFWPLWLKRGENDNQTAKISKWSPIISPKWPQMTAHYYHQCNRFISTPTIYDKGPLGPSKGAKIDSEQLQNVSQGLLFPLVCAQNGLKWPQMTPKVYHQYTRVISCVTAHDLGPMGLKNEAKKDSEQLQNVSQVSTLCPKWPQMAPYDPQSLPIAN